MAKVDDLRRMIAEAERIVAFTGAGISTESGIPDFRSPGGIWTKYKPIEFGDPFHLDLRRTLSNALTRDENAPRRRMEGRAGLRLAADDFEVFRTEQLTRTATVLLVDMSRSMLLRGCFLAAKKVSWKPKIFVNSVSIDPFVMEVVQRNTSKRLVEGAISSAFLKDPTDPALARDLGVKLYKQILRRYVPGAKVKEVAHLYGMAVAYTMVDALRKAGAQPTRASLLRAATHLNERTNPFFVKGIAVKTGPNDYYPVERSRMLRFHLGRWRQFGTLVSVR